MPQRRRVLIVEDIKFNQALLADILGAEYELALAADGEEAVLKAKELHPEIVFMDLTLPKMDGFEAARQIRRQVGPRSKIIAMSANADEVRKTDARVAGMDFFLAKPFNAKSVAQLLAQIFPSRTDTPAVKAVRQ